MPDAFPVFFDRRIPYDSQASVMPVIVRGQDVLFAAPTASGKTEAAIAPLLQRHLSFRRSVLSTVYVAPTKALVNDLYERLVGALRARFPNAFARYTGDRHELRDPVGRFCVLVTPEALDSLQLRHPETLADVRAVVIDEIHLLHGQPRGQQLRHVIDRLRVASTSVASQRDRFQVVGMTATLDDIETVRDIWLGDGAKVVSEGSPRQITSELLDVPEDSAQDPLLSRARAIARWLDSVDVDKLLIFANARNTAHSIAAHLHRELEGTRWPVHLHFGALSASHRERVEDLMRREKCGVCIATSTLELGIDIGDIDAVALAELPASVSAFLQRIGRGNRRSDICRVLGFRSSIEEEQVFHALVDCGRRGELDDAHEYDRASVRFQQVVSLCWRAMRSDRGLTLAALAREAGTTTHAGVVRDMVDTGRLKNVGGALLPCDRLVDVADAGRIHTVIAGQSSVVVRDSKTGEAALRMANDTRSGDAVFVGGSMRRLVQDTGGDSFLSDSVNRSRRIARIRAVGRGQPLSRSVVWALARQLCQDPTTWKIFRLELKTWGGEPFNRLVAQFLTRYGSKGPYRPSTIGVHGPMPNEGITIEALHDWAMRTERDADLPLSVAKRFADPSRFYDELSSELAAEERRRSVPWSSFRRWLAQIRVIEKVNL